MRFANSIRLLMENFKQVFKLLLYRLIMLVLVVALCSAFVLPELKEIANEQGKSVASVAIRWILDYLQDSVVIVGAKSPRQILQNVEALDWTLTQEQINRLEEISKE